jgi:molybdopterin-guanine dinucleotide biosynthesis protein A
MVGDSERSPGPPVSAIVLAGGQSKRLGKDKALLEVQGQPLVSRTVQKLDALSDDLLVVTSDPARYVHLGLPARLISDERPGVGSLMGIYSGLQVARHTNALAVACDMPFLNLPLLRYMVPLADGHDVVIPRFGGFLEPLHAIYGKSCLPFMAGLLERGRRQIIAFFDQVRVRYVEESEIERFDPDHLSFVNVNTPGDWERVQALLSGSL